MFKLFGKKPEAEKPEKKEPAGKDPKVQEFAARFSPEETAILAVTGAAGFTGSRLEDTGLWVAGMPLTAWMEEDGDPTIHREAVRLMALADDKLLDFLRQRVPRDNIISVTVRPALEGSDFLLVGLPAMAFDPELKAILEEQKLPRVETLEGLGEFTLNRSVGVFQAEVDWAGQPVELCFDKDEDREACAGLGRELLAGCARWDADARALAADKLLDTVNQWAAEDGAEETTREDFVADLEAETIDLSASGEVHLYYNGGPLLAGRFIHVSGTVSGGPADAQTEE